MARNVVLEEASHNQMDPREMMRNLQKRMDEMQNWYEGLKTFWVENTTMQQGQGTMDPVLSTMTHISTTEPSYL